MKKEYIVGIDFGHGETSAWAVPLDLSIAKKEGYALKLKNTNIAASRSYSSAIYMDTNGHYSLMQSEGKNIIFGFKDKVSNLKRSENIGKYEAYKEYIKQIYQHLISLNTELKVEGSETNFYLCIACPTKWEQQEKDDYIRFFNDVLCEFGVEVMWVINESDAAYFTHGSLDRYADNCVLIIDYGSSTIDYTVVNRGKKISDDNWSNRLGASHIENIILDEYRNKSTDYQAKMQHTITKLHEEGLDFIEVNSSIKFKIREAKEDSVVRGRYPNLRFEYNLIGEKTNYGTTEAFKAEKSRYNFEFDSQIDTLISEYKERVENDLKDLKDKIGNISVDYVILSGGACLIPWLKTLVNNIFEPKDIYLDPEASFVVSKGIAKYARAQLDALDKLRSEILKLDFEDIYRQADTNAISEAIKVMVPSLVSKLKSSQSPLTGNDIRKKFCDFIENLNANNIEYSKIVQQEFDNLITSSVRDSLYESILSVFKIKVDTSDVKLNIPIDIVCWNEKEFMPGEDNFYSDFTEWIERSSSRLCFSWDKLRYDPELSNIVDGTVRELESKVKNLELVYTEPENIAEYVNRIKKDVLIETEEIFYKYQLFNTTFLKGV